MPRETVIAFSAPIWEEIGFRLDEPDEAAGVMLAGVAEDDDRLVLSVNRMLWVPAEHYVERGPRHLKIASSGWVPALKQAVEQGLQPIFFHTHPRGRPVSSRFDEEVDAALAEPFRLRARVTRYASMIVGGDSRRPHFTGQVLTETGDRFAIGRARIVGARLQILPAFDRADEAAAAGSVHSRQILAFGSAGQTLLGGLRVGVVGAGGTGSAVFEQLVRLGVGEIVTVDDDRITSTNVSRVYGSTLADEGVPKVDVADAHARRIGLGTTVQPVVGRVTDRSVLRRLTTCDVIFGCTDDHTGRLNLSRLAFWYLIPVIDLGVAIDAPDERVRSITGRITYVAPGEPCLLCRGVVNPDRLRDESYSNGERERLAGEGYAEGLGEPDPSVLAYTTMVAAWGIADLIERLFGFGDERVAGELLLRIADRKVKGRHAEPQAGHFCADPLKRGLGDQNLFLGQRVWPDA